MKNNYHLVCACLFLSITGLNFSLAQSSGPEFLDCNIVPTSLCISDAGVRLPANNKIYLGEQNPSASSCTVHVTQSIKVRSTCGKRLQYEVLLFTEDDTAVGIILQSLTTISTDSVFEAELSYESESSPDGNIHHNGIPYTTGCNNYHRIKWIVRDSCGEEASCEQRIELYDCSKPYLPNPGKIYSIRSSMTGFISLQLDSILKDPVDDCSIPSAIKYSLNEDYFKQDSSFHLCDIPAWGVELPYNIWMGDEGRDINCDGQIEWSERNIQKQQVLFVFTSNGSIDCGEGDPFFSGQVVTEDNQPVEKVEITLTSPGHVYPIFITGMDGTFNFIPSSGEQHTLTAMRNDHHRNGVSTLDLVKIQKHLLGTEPLSSPYKMIAADANISQSVSAIDMIELRKLILGIYTELPSNKSWRFVPKKYNFQDTLHPWISPDSLTFDPNNPGNLDFIGIKIGDVNNTVKANVQSFLSRGFQPEVNWYTDQKNYAKDEVFNIHFFVDEPRDIQGFQFTFSDPDLEFMKASSENIQLSENDYGLFDDKITLSWFNHEGANFSPDEIVFTLTVRAKRAGDLNNLTINADITESEMYNMQDDVLIPKLLLKDNTPYSEVFSPQPNPWKEETKIPVFLDQAGIITLNVFDLNGRCVYTKNEDCIAGSNNIILDANAFSSRGLLYFSIRTSDITLTRNMIVLD